MPGYIVSVLVTAVTVNHSLGVLSATVEAQNAVLAAVMVTAITEKCGFGRSTI